MPRRQRTKGRWGENDAKSNRGQKSPRAEEEELEWNTEESAIARAHTAGW